MVEHVLSFVQVLIWPALLFFFLICFKGGVNSILKALANTIEKRLEALTFPGGKVQFAKFGEVELPEVELPEEVKQQTFLEYPDIFEAQSPHK